MGWGVNRNLCRRAGAEVVRHSLPDRRCCLRRLIVRPPSRTGLSRMFADPDRGTFFGHGQDETVAAEAAAKRKSRMRSMAARRMTPWPVLARRHLGGFGSGRKPWQPPRPIRSDPFDRPIEWGPEVAERTAFYHSARVIPHGSPPELPGGIQNPGTVCRPMFTR